MKDTMLRVWLISATALASVQAQPYVISTYAGGASLPLPPAPASSVSIGFPGSLATDSVGNVYFIASDLNSVFKVDRAGLLTRVAGNSTPGFAGDGGPALSARLRVTVAGVSPGLAVDGAGNLFIADSGNNRVRRIRPDGVIDTVAGNGPASFSGDDGPAADASLQNPSGLAVDSAGNLFIGDSGNGRIRKVSPAGIITTVTMAESIQALTVDGAGNLFFVSRNGLYKISPDGSSALVTAGALVLGVAADRSGNVFFSDPRCGCVRKLSANGAQTTIAGNGTLGFSGDGGPATAAQLFDPWDLAVNGAGDVFFSDRGNRRIRKVSLSGIISTVAGGGALEFPPPGDGGPATGAELKLSVIGLGNQSGIAVDGGGNLYIAETANHRIRKVTADGIISTVAGVGPRCPGHLEDDCLPLGDGGPATSAALSLPAGVAVDRAGNLFIADYGNIRIRKVSPDGIITTVAGNGELGSAGDGGPATSAQLNALGVAVDGAGNLYIATGGSIRKVSADGIITTVAPGYSASAVAVDGADNLYFADNECGDEFCDYFTRVLSTDGTVSTIAGVASGLPEASGDGGPANSARLGYTPGIAVDSSGNVFIVDLYGERIREVSRDGIVSTIAGGLWGYSGDGGPATAAAMFYPMSVAAGADGAIFVSDAFNNVIRVLRPEGDASR